MRARHAEVHAGLARGLTVPEAGRTLRLARKSVRSATATNVDQLIGGLGSRSRACSAHRTYLRLGRDEGSAAPDGCIRDCASAATRAACARCG